VLADLSFPVQEVNLSNRMMIAALGLLAVGPLSAQQRNIHLTGNPVAELDEPFTTINGLREVAPGKVVIADMSEQRLVMADFARNSVSDIGRRGSGPGEWRFAMSVLQGPGGTAYVADPELRKMHVVDATGKIVRTVPFGGEGGNGPGNFINVPRASDAQGRYYFTGSPFTPGERAQPDSVPIIRYDPASGRADTVAKVPNEVKVTQSGSTSGTMRVMARVGGGPYSANTQWLPLPDGRLALVHPSPYRVDIVDHAGKVTLGTAVPYTPIRIGKAERDAYRKAVASSPGMSVRVTNGGAASISSGPPPADRPPIPDSDFPETMPPFVSNAAQVAPNGDIWVLRSRAAGDPNPSYDIWSPSGRLVGKATLRPRSQVVGFGAGAVYVSRQDPEDDLRYLEKYVLPSN
jgi:hypothetical protein